jgi:hypothetical protein
MKKKRNYSHRTNYSKKENDANNSFLSKTVQSKQIGKLSLSTNKRSMSMNISNR